MGVEEGKESESQFLVFFLFLVFTIHACTLMPIVITLYASGLTSVALTAACVLTCLHIVCQLEMRLFTSWSADIDELISSTTSIMHSKKVSKLLPYPDVHSRHCYCFNGEEVI